MTNRDNLPHLQRVMWLAAIPCLASQMNLLARPRHWGGVAPRRSWLPLAMFETWIVVSGVHLWCLGYIYDLPLQVFLLAPALSVASWTLYNRRTDFAPNN